MAEECFTVEGMACAGCAANLERKIRGLSGVRGVTVSLPLRRMTVTFENGTVSRETIQKSAAELGFSAAVIESKIDSERGRIEAERAESARLKRRFFLSLLFLVPLLMISTAPMSGLPTVNRFSGPSWGPFVAAAEFFLTLPILWLNRAIFLTGFRRLFSGAPNMDSLVALGAGASFLYSFYASISLLISAVGNDPTSAEKFSTELYFESAASILTIITLGRWLESRSRRKTSDAVARLVKLAPETAVVLIDGKETAIPTEMIEIGTIVVIRPGDRIPADGVVTSGASTVDESALTGEAIPAAKKAGDSVFSATINHGGYFQFRAERVGGETTLARMIELVENAGSSKAPAARIADRVCAVFVPAVMTAAMATALIWLAAGRSFSFALTMAISVLVISCPCALGLATPLAIMVGTGKGALSGILVKSASVFENLNGVKTAVFDKTGTMTEGKPEVTDVIPISGMTAGELLATVTSLERFSEHPLADAVRRAAEDRKIAPKSGSDFTSLPGNGISGRVDGKVIWIGNRNLMESRSLDPLPLDADSIRLGREGKTILWVADETKILGLIAAGDRMKPTAAETVRRLKEIGIETILLTGDHRMAAEAMGRELDVDQVLAEVRPAEKEEQIRSLQKKGGKVVMVGDGINDAPSLVRADVGMAIGAGTDIAIDSADIVLMKSDPIGVVDAIRLGRRVVRKIHENLFWAFFYNMIGIPIAAGILYPRLGWRLHPVWAAAAMGISSLCVVLNSLRLRSEGKP